MSGFGAEINSKAGLRMEVVASGAGKRHNRDTAGDGSERPGGTLPSPVGPFLRPGNSEGTDGDQSQGQGRRMSLAERKKLSVARLLSGIRFMIAVYVLLIVLAFLVSWGQM